jgi:hypothetical protein
MGNPLTNRREDGTLTPRVISREDETLTPGECSKDGLSTPGGHLHTEDGESTPQGHSHTEDGKSTPQGSHEREMMKLTNLYLVRMLDAYVECALWSSTTCDEDGNNPESMDHYHKADIATECLNEMREDVNAFANDNVADLAGIDAGQAGHDFWLTRNGHGAGFWDRGLGDKGDRLTDACRPYGSVDLYVGDDGLVYC